MTEDSTVKEYLEALAISTKNKSPDNIVTILDTLRYEFEKNIDSRRYAVQNGAHDLILNVLTSFNDDSRIVGSALKPMIRLTSFRRDPLNQEEIRCQIEFLKRKMTLINAQLVLRWVKQCCIKSEKNRQNIYDAGVVDEVKNIFGDDATPGSKVRDVCSLLRALTLDDDPTVDYGNSVGRTCDIANDTLAPITMLLRRFKYERKVVREILDTLSVLSIRSMHCKIIEEAGGLDPIIEIMSLFPDDENLNCIILKLMKILSVNDQVKLNLVTLGAAHLLLSAISRIQTGAICVAGLSCMAALTLRSPRNSGIFYDCEAPSLIIETMKMYPGSVKVQRCGTRVIANMTIINTVEARVFKTSGVEEVLETAMKMHSDDLDDDVRTAFGNLGINNELKDHWTKIKT